MYVLILILLEQSGATNKTIEGFQTMEACQRQAHQITGDRRPFSAAITVFESPGGRGLAYCKPAKR